MSKAEGRYICIRFTEPITTDVTTCSLSAFTVTGQEYNFVPGGTLEGKAYAVKSISAHPAEPNGILLEMVGLKRFPSVVGNLTVAYDAAVGNLAGTGGPVESFSLSFAPEGLIAKPHQNDQEHIEISDITATGNLIPICYTDVQNGGEHLEITNITAVGTLTHIDDI
jgi:hypothetical protein